MREASQKQLIFGIWMSSRCIAYIPIEMCFLIELEVKLRNKKKITKRTESHVKVMNTNQLEQQGKNNTNRFLFCDGKRASKSRLVWGSFSRTNDVQIRTRTCQLLDGNDAWWSQDVIVSACVQWTNERILTSLSNRKTENQKLYEQTVSPSFRHYTQLEQQQKIIEKTKSEENCTKYGAEVRICICLNFLPSSLNRSIAFDEKNLISKF